MTDDSGTHGEDRIPSDPTPSPSDQAPSPFTGEGWDGGSLPSPSDPAEVAEIIRLNEALERLAAGGDAGIDPREDPELSALLATALAVDGVLQDATAERSFQSFHHRSRAAILHSLEADRPVPMRERMRLIVAAAAGLAAVVIGVSAIGAPLLDSRDGGGDATPGAQVSAPNLTHLNAQQHVSNLTAALESMKATILSGQSLSSSHFHALSENSARTAETIDRAPDTVDPATVRAVEEAVREGRQALSQAQAEPGAENAALAASRAIEDLDVVASGYLRGAIGPGEGAATPEPTPDPTSTPEPTPEPTPTSTPEPTSTPTPTPEATVDAASATPDAPADAAGE